MTRTLDEALESQKEVNKRAGKPGFLTSEFLMAALPELICILVKLGIIQAGSPLAEAVANIGMLLIPCVYMIARTGLKKGGQKAFAFLLEKLKEKDTPKDA